MTAIQQFYGGAGVPMTVPGEPGDIARAWRSHRARLRAWFADLDDDAWDRPTRCAGWTTTDMAQHLVTGAQHLGYTLHQARKGVATQNLAGFDSQATAAAAAAMLDGLTPAALVEQLEHIDGRVDAELDGLTADGWQATAEAPPGHVPAHVAVNHFLFDSWVHERDLLLPAGETPLVDQLEAVQVAAYVLALGGIAHTIYSASPVPVARRLRLTDIDRVLRVDVHDGRSAVTFADATSAPDASLEVATLADLATGRDVPDSVELDPTTSALLRELAVVMAS